MNSKEVLLVLTDQWADGEAAYAVAEVNSAAHYSVKTISFDKKSKTSIGGLRTQTDYDIKEYTDFSRLALIILPDVFSWGDHPYDEIADFIKQVRDEDIITPNETAAVDFAYEIYKLLEIDDVEEIEAWHDKFKNGFVRKGFVEK